MRTEALTLAEMGPTCGKCKHFRRVEEWGNCKAGLPHSQMLVDGNGDEYQVTFWGQVDADEGACGHFEAAQ